MLNLCAFSKDSPYWPFRLIATDLDGTLLRPDGSLSKHTISVLQQMQAKGIAIVIATARPPRELRCIVQDLYLRGFAICCSGAVIYDTEHDIILQKHTLSPTQIELIIHYLRATLP